MTTTAGQILPFGLRERDSERYRKAAKWYRDHEVRVGRDMGLAWKDCHLLRVDLASVCTRSQ
jgi:hypothetical protein